LFWPAVFHFICAIGFLYVGPIMLAIVSRAAPLSVNAMMVGAYYLSIFAGGMASGWLGRFYQPLSPAAFWALHGLIVAGGAVVTIAFRGPLVRILRLGGRD
ncbi:MAG TPA: MFS transporter, partial [Sphingomonadales bacterium]